jgi:hypothetical protein
MWTFSKVNMAFCISAFDRIFLCPWWGMPQQFFALQWGKSCAGRLANFMHVGSFAAFTHGPLHAICCGRSSKKYRKSSTGHHLRFSKDIEELSPNVVGYNQRRLLNPVVFPVCAVRAKPWILRQIFFHFTKQKKPAEFHRKMHVVHEQWDGVLRNRYGRESDEFIYASVFCTRNKIEIQSDRGPQNDKKDPGNCACCSVYEAPTVSVGRTEAATTTIDEWFYSNNFTRWKQRCIFYIE